jgi:glucan phosphoethanolaminetransferase (alkaline phosphatase superfamily)
MLRPAPLYIVLSYLLISLTPFISIFLGKPVDQALELLVFEAMAWLGLWAVFRRPRWFHWLLLPVFFALPIEIYLRLYYGQGISTHHLGIIAETSPKEAVEFLGGKVWLLLFVSLAILAWWSSILFFARRTDALDWRHRSYWLVIAVFMTGVGVWGYGKEIGVSSKPHTAAEKSNSAQANSAESEDSDEEGIISASVKLPVSIKKRSSSVNSDSPYSSAFKAIYAELPKLPHWAKIPYDNEVFGRTWPFGLALRGADFWSEHTYLSELAEKSRNFLFNARQKEGDQRPQTIVVVIGESSRFDRWSLNGYDRQTNPVLEKESNLVSFSDVVTAVSATRLSVPIIVSRKPATQSLKAGFSEKSFMSAFKEAGFKTYWLSNQMSFGEFDTPISVFAKEADVTEFLNLGGFTNTSNYDQILLAPMRNALADPAPKKLIVLHTLGNHWNYSHRYPIAYDKWRPSLFGITNPAYTDLKNKQALNNSYDNSILYIDWMLGQVISGLKEDHEISSLLYVSDHGQTLYDGSCNLAFHGHNTQYEFHIPMFMWFSDRYKIQHADKIAQLYRHKNFRLSTENVFHSLLDMADIRYPGERLEWSFLSPSLKAHTRYVDSYGWSNYDDATFKGDCREVMDRKTPLVQEK